MSILKDSALVAVDGCVIVMVMVAAGAFLARHKILDKATSERVSKLVMTLLLPCLLFTEIMKCLDPSKIEQFVIIFIFCTCNCYLVHVFIGMGVGWILSKLLGASHDSGRLIMACIGFQGTTAIPIVFASVLGDSQLTKSDKNFGVDAITYVLIFTVFVTIYKWTIAYNLLEPQYAFVPSALLYNNDDIEVEGGDSLIIVQKSFWWKLKKSINPPLVATIIAIPLALIPYSKEYVFTGSGSVLSGNLFRALGIMGAMVSPTINLVLGSNLSEGYPPTADIRWSHIIIIIIGKEVIMPGVGLVLAYTCYYYDIINRCLALMIMIIYAAPTSLQLLMICSGFKSQVENISKLYLIMYCTAAIPLAFWTMGFAIVLYDL